MKLIISDTTALIVLSKTNNLKLLTNFIDIVYIPSEVMKEIEYKDDKVKNIIQNSDFIQLKALTKEIPHSLLNSKLDRGEIEAIALALETDLGLIIDEKSGRQFAEKEGVVIIGLLGILKVNLLKKHISYADVLYILDEFKNVDFRLSKKLERDFLNDLENLN